jgi:type I restriction enzyme R subunit
VFLPFNQGDTAAPATRVNPAGGHRTAYLWEQVWARESWLEILGRYLIAQRDKKKQITRVLFPRYHQLDVTRKLQAAVLRDGPGGKYLVQHSAGSGKTNSIAWTAHFFAELHDARTIARCSTPCWSCPTATSSTRSSRRRSSTSSARPASSRPSRARARARAPSWPRPCRAPRRSSSAPSRPSRSPSRPCASWRPPRASASPSSPTRPTARRPARRPQAQGRALAPRSSPGAQRRRRGQHRGHPRGPDGGARRRHRHHLRGVHGDAQEQDARALFGTRPDPSRKPAADNIPRRSTSTPCARPSRRSFILDVLQELHALQPRLQARPRGQGDRRQGGRAQRGHEEDHGLGEAPPLQHRPEGAGRRRALPQARGAAARRHGQGDGRGRQPHRGRALAARDREVHQGARLPDRHAGGLLGRGRRQRVGPRPFHREQPRAEPQLKGRDIREAFKGRRVPDAAGRQQVPDRLRPAAALRHVRRQAAGGHPGRADALAAQPRPPRQGHDLRRRLRQRPGRGARRVQEVPQTAELSATTDPNLVFDLRGKLDSAGHYDDFEVDRVVAVELDPKAKQSDLVAALEPVPTA